MSKPYESNDEKEEDKDELWYEPTVFAALLQEEIYPKPPEELHPISDLSDEASLFEAGGASGGPMNTDGHLNIHDPETGSCGPRQAADRQLVNIANGYVDSADSASPRPFPGRYESGAVEPTMLSRGTGPVYSWKSDLSISKAETNKPFVGAIVSASSIAAPPMLPIGFQPTPSEHGLSSRLSDPPAPLRVSETAGATSTRAESSHLESAVSFMCNHKPCVSKGRQCFQTQDDCDRHNQVVFEHKHRFKCEVCDDHPGFGYPKDLRRHMLVHGDPQFSCPECGRPFHRDEHVIRHLPICKGTWSPPPSKSRSKRSRFQPDARLMVDSVTPSLSSLAPIQPSSQELYSTLSTASPVITRSPLHDAKWPSADLETLQSTRLQTFTATGPNPNLLSSFASSSPSRTSPVFSSTASPAPQFTPSTALSSFGQGNGFPFTAPIQVQSGDQELLSSPLQHKHKKVRRRS